jgi:hypothetical protein
MAGNVEFTAQVFSHMKEDAMNKAVVSLISLALAGLVSCTCRNANGRHLQYRDNDVYYEVYGNSPKVLFFVHGWTNCTRVWKYQLMEFGGYKVVAVDLPGNGNSSRNEKAPSTMIFFADCVHAVAKM